MQWRSQQGEPGEPGVFEQQVKPRRHADHYIDGDLVDADVQEVFHLVQIHGHLVGERARAFAGEVAHGHALQLVHDHAPETGDGGADEPLRLCERLHGEPAVQRPEQQVAERVNADPLELLLHRQRRVVEDAVNQQADGGVKRDVADALPKLKKYSPRQGAALDLEQRPQALEAGGLGGRGHNAQTYYTHNTLSKQKSARRETRVGARDITAAP